eukprot:scaffold1398_cov116-Cylindrotheca_fusiformis.AAC.32
MVNIQDDDSATTWGRGGSDEPSLPPIPPQQEVEESSESLPTSPLTQTLKVLSQNMDDLRYSDNTQHNSPCSPSSLSKNNSSSNETTKENSKTNPSPPESSNQPTKQTTGTATTTTTTNRPYDANNPRHLLWKDYQDEWMRFNVYIPESAKLGLRIQSATFDYGSNNDDENATKDYCCHVLSSFGMAKEEYGLESGDWIAWPFENSSSCHVELADFALAQAWAKQRPFHVCILRRRRRREQTKEEEQQVPQQQDTATKTKTTSNPNNKPNDKSTFPTPHKDNDDNNNNNSLKRAAPNQAKSLSSSTITAPTSSNIRSSLEGRFMTRANLASSRILSQPKKSSPSAETTTAAAGAAGSQTSTKGSFSKSRPPTITPSKTSNKNNKKSHEKTATTSYQLKTTTKPRTSSPPPYCLKCNANTTGTMQRPRMHHAWCEHNEFYDDSGAQEIVQRIQHGIQVHCSVCQMEYQKGKLLVSSTSSLSQQQKYQHNPKCLQYQQRQRQQELQKKKKSLSPKKRRRNQDLNLSSSDSSSSSSDDEDEDDDDEVSCYKPQRKKSKIHVLSVSPPPRRNNNNNSMKRKSNNNTKKKKVPRRKPTKTTSTPKTKRPATTTTKVTPPTASSSSPNEEQQQQLHGVKSNWIACDENPWGPPGHQDGDVLLYGPQPGIFATTASARESLVVPKRYTLEPFAVSSPYRNTHYTPQEGFTMLSLRREPLARRPWGFQVVWDEFGHACLVESVDRLSPAAAASFVGESASTSSGLKVNDMILSINGKLVGGMTEDGVEIELATCGPSLLLVVSRYKHASLVQRKFVNVERRMLRAIDSAARDDRVLGWTEIGNAKTDPLDSNDEESSTSPPPGMQQHRRDIAIRSGAAVQRGVQQDDQESVSDVIGESRMENESANSISSEAGPQTLEQDNNFGIQNSTLDGSDSGRARQSNDLSNQYPDDDCTQDQNAWNGCVCGKLHTKTDGSDGIFWIQCESCQSWYDVSQNCVGFDMEQAKQTENWTCWACPSIAASTQASLSIYGGQNHAEPPQDSLNNDRCHDSMAALDPPHDQEPSTTPLSAAVMEEVKKKVHSVLRKRLRSDGTLLPRSKPKRLEDGTFQRPAGKPPKHFIWNFESGVWEIKGTNRGITQASPSMNSGQNHAEAPHDSQNNDRCHDSMAVLDPPDDQEPSTTPPSAVVMEEVKKKIHSVLRKRLGSDGTLLPRSKPNRREDGTFQRPAGKPPKHFKWNFESGVWVIKGSPKHVRAKQKPSRAARKGQDWKPPRTPPKVRSILPETPATDSLPSELIGKATGSFETGDLVYVKPHSWPGKNCQGGIGHIVEKPYENDEGIVCHTVRYAIGSLEKFIEAAYISPYSFR